MGYTSQRQQPLGIGIVVKLLTLIKEETEEQDCKRVPQGSSNSGNSRLRFPERAQSLHDGIGSPTKTH
jgi:hypothetical protein